MPHGRWEAQEQELTGVSRGHPRDVRWRLELLPDGHETWGNRSTRVRGLGLLKELANGRVAWQLANDEWVVVLMSAWRKKR
jgi:hypothetical protein